MLTCTSLLTSQGSEQATGPEMLQLASPHCQESLVQPAQLDMQRLNIFPYELASVLNVSLFDVYLVSLVCL